MVLHLIWKLVYKKLVVVVEMDSLARQYCITGHSILLIVMSI